LEREPHPTKQSPNKAADSNKKQLLQAHKAQVLEQHKTSTNMPEYTIHSSIPTSNPKREGTKHLRPYSFHPY